MTREDSEFRYETESHVEAEHKENFNAHRSRRSMCHLNMKEHGLNVWSTVLDTKSFLVSINYSMQFSFSSKYAGNRNVVRIVRRLYKAVTVFKTEKTGTGKRFMLRPRQKSVKFMQRISWKLTRLDGIILVHASALEQLRKPAQWKISTQNLVPVTWIVVASSSRSRHSLRCLQSRYWVRNQILKRMKQIVLPTVSS